MKWIVLVSVLLALLLAGCVTQQPPTCEEVAQQEENPDNLPFETIAPAPYNGDASWKNEEPGLFVLTTPEDVSVIEQYIPEEAISALHQVDFDTYIVVAAFSGWKPSAEFSFCITTIQPENQIITLRAHLIQLIGPIPATDASYYHLLQAPRSKVPKGDISFQLVLTRHEYVNPPGRQPTWEISQEGIVASVTRSLP